MMKKECEHKNVNTWFDKDSGDDAITCKDCGKVWYHESYLQKIMKEHIEKGIAICQRFE